MFAVTVYFGHYFAAAHYDYAVGHAEDLRHFRRYHDNALALLDKAVHYVVNLDLCADVDTTGRFVKDKDLCIRVDPLADYDLLLVTTGQLAYDLIDRRGLDAQRRNVLLARLEDLLFVQEQARREALHVSKNQVGANGLSQYQTLSLTVLGEERNAVMDRLTRGLDMYFLALDLDLAAVDRICAEYCAHNLGTTGADHLQSPESVRRMP